jgi:hypothetical protein
MKSWRLGSFSIILLLVAALCQSGCSLWNRVWSAQGEEQKAEKSKAAAPSKEPVASAPAAPQSGKAEKTDPAVKTEEKDKKAEKPLTESQKEWEEKIVRSPFLVSGEYFRQKAPPEGTFDLGFGWLFGRAKEEEQKRKGLEERLAKLEAELAAGGAPTAAPKVGASLAKVVSVNGRAPVNRVAMVGFEPETPNPKGFGRIPLEIVTSALERDTRLILVEPPLVDRVLRDHGIRPSAANAKQIATLLERDLGTQLVIFLDEAGVNSDWDRRGQVQAQVVLKGEIREGVTGHALSLLSAKGTQTGSGSQEALARVEALKHRINCPPPSSRRRSNMNGARAFSPLKRVGFGSMPAVAPASRRGISFGSSRAMARRSTTPARNCSSASTLGIRRERFGLQTSSEPTLPSRRSRKGQALRRMIS